MMALALPKAVGEGCWVKALFCSSPLPLLRLDSSEPLMLSQGLTSTSPGVRMSTSPSTVCPPAPEKLNVYMVSVCLAQKIINPT